MILFDIYIIQFEIKWNIKHLFTLDVHVCVCACACACVSKRFSFGLVLVFFFFFCSWCLSRVWMLEEHPWLKYTLSDCIQPFYDDKPKVFIMDVKIYSVESGFISDCDEVPFNIIWKGSVLILLAILPILEEVKASQCHVTNNKISQNGMSESAIASSFVFS